MEDETLPAKQPPANYTGLGIAVGAGIGTVLGVSTGQLAVWLPVGIAIGVAVGVGLARKGVGRIPPPPE